MFKKILVVLFCIIACYSNSDADTASYLKMFYGYFRESALNCTKNIKSVYYNWVEKVDKAKFESIDQDTALMVVFNGINGNVCFPGNKGTNLNDEKVLDFIVDVVLDTTLERNRRIQAADLLTNRTTYKSLEKYKYRLLTSVEELYKLNFDKIQELFALLNLTEEEKGNVYIKQNIKLKLAVRARFGDTAAIAQLIATFESKTQSYWNKEQAVKQLIYSGNVKAIQYCLTNFNKPVFDVIEKKGKKCKARSIRYTIIYELSFYFPNEPLLNEELTIAGKRYNVEREFIKSYLRRFVDWAEKQYGVKPVDPEPEPFLQGLCYQ